MFNPTLQSLTFDPQGHYIRRYVPELSTLSAPAIHEPATADETELDAANVRPGETYPHPIVNHPWARKRALDAYASIRDNL